ncbi:MAG: hypothetical protein ACOVNZ_02550 [Crocinitomicaceae bacterium]
MDSNNDLKFEDLKTELEARRLKEWKWVSSNFTITLVHLIKGLFSFDFTFFSNYKFMSQFYQDYFFVGRDLDHMVDLKIKIKRQIEKEVLFSPDELEYYGFDYLKLIQLSDKYLQIYEPQIIARGGYKRDKNDKNFTELMKFVKTFRRCRDQFNHIVPSTIFDKEVEFNPDLPEEGTIDMFDFEKD